MLKRSLAKNVWFISVNEQFPQTNDRRFAEDAPDKVKIMFIALFDENKDVVERILNFKDQSEQLLKEYGYDAKITTKMKIQSVHIYGLCIPINITYINLVK